MLSALCKSISLSLYKNGAISQDEIDICQYGFEISISTVINFLIVAILGILLGMKRISLLYYIIFVIIRQYTGGYHADTYLSCNLKFGVLSLFLLGNIKILSIYQEYYSFDMHLLLSCFSFLVIWFLAPVENENKPLTELKKRKNHAFSILFVIGMLTISSIMLNQFFTFSITIEFTLFLVSMLVLYSKIKKKDERCK